MYGNNFFFKGFNTLSSRTSTAWSVKSFCVLDIWIGILKSSHKKRNPLMMRQIFTSNASRVYEGVWTLEKTSSFMARVARERRSYENTSWMT